MAEVINVAVAIPIREDKRILVCRRSAEQHLAGIWEWPGGKVERGESTAEALKRECMEELGVAPASILPLCETRHEYATRTVQLHFFVTTFREWPTCSLSAEGNEMRWVSLEDLDTLPLPPANQHAVNMLKVRYALS